MAPRIIRQMEIKKNIYRENFFDFTHSILLLEMGNKILASKLLKIKKY